MMLLWRFRHFSPQFIACQTNIVSLSVTDTCAVFLFFPNKIMTGMTRTCKMIFHVCHQRTSLISFLSISKYFKRFIDRMPYFYFYFSSKFIGFHFTPDHAHNSWHNFLLKNNNVKIFTPRYSVSRQAVSTSCCIMYF